MSKHLGLIVLFGTALGLPLIPGGQARAGVVTATFDDLGLDPESYWRGPDPGGSIVPGPYGDVMVGSFTSGGVSFVNKSELTYGSWSGFAYSNTTDVATPGFGNQFSAYAGSGRDGDGAYGVAFGYHDVNPNLLSDPFDPTNIEHLEGLPYFTLPTGASIESMYVTNTTYAALAMIEGDSFIGRPFGGEDKSIPDWFKLTAYGTDASGTILNAHVDFYLADNREGQMLILNQWARMDLSALAGAERLYFNLSGTLSGIYGLDVPAYFAVDDIQYRLADAAVPEPSSLAMGIVGAGVIGLMIQRRKRAV